MLDVSRVRKVRLSRLCHTPKACSSLRAGGSADRSRPYHPTPSLGVVPLKLKQFGRLGPEWLPWFVTLLVVCVALRVFILVITDPIIEPDTSTYVQLAHELVSGNLSGDNGARTPAYPLLLILTGSNPFSVRIAQMLLGLVATSALFFVAWKLTRNGLLSTLVAASYGLSMLQVRYEDDLMTETLTTSTLLLTIAVLTATVDNPRRLLRSKLVVLGALVSVVALARPSFLYLPVVFLLPFVAALKPYRRSMLYYILPAFIPIIVWSLFNYERLGYLGPTTLGGYNLTNHSGAFIEYAPARYSAIKTIYLEARAANGGKYHNAIWMPNAITRMMQVTGQSFPELSKTLTSMSIGLFVSHPVLYLRSVSESWLQFWNAPGADTWRWEQGVHNPTVRTALALLARAQRAPIVGANAIFLLAVLVAACMQLLRKRPVTDCVGWTVIAIVLLSSAVSAAMEGPNSRFGLPIQPLVALMVITLARGSGLLPLTGALLSKPRTRSA